MVTRLHLENCRLNNRYEVHKLLGEGSYAEIYLARDTFAASNAPFAWVVIKALNVYLQGEPDPDLERTLVENLKNEAIALDLLHHPNIVSRLGHGTARNLEGRIFHYLILEYLPGGDLSKLCKPNGLDFDKVLYYLEQVCAGLMYAHEKGIIHRDIKPQNLLLTADRQIVKITDFGVVRFADLDTPVTLVGTNVYAPPEHNPLIADGTARKITPAADIYSLAKTVYVLLTGELPKQFTGKPITNLPERFQKELWADDLLSVLEKATQTDPEERYQTVQSFWAELIKIKQELKTATDLQDSYEEESETLLAQVTPQAKVSADFSLQTLPQKPEFKISYDLAQTQIAQESIRNPNSIPTTIDSGNQVPQRQNEFEINLSEDEEPLRSKILKTTAFILVYAIALFATQHYLRNYVLVPTEAERQSKKLVGISTTDVNIRPSAGTQEPPIGLLPKGSRVRILDTKDNWYLIDVIEYSRPKTNPKSADKGWVNKKYIEIQGA
jgi:serine/threonine protein kinase